MGRMTRSSFCRGKGTNRRCGAETQKQAIAAKCKDCSYDKYDKGTWRQQVEACGGETCPLYLYRPVSEPHKDTPTRSNGATHEQTTDGVGVD